MKLINKVFGGINLTWPKLIIFAVLAGVYTGLINQVPFLFDTSFRDIAISFECWILFGVFIIMNSKSALDSALKCLVFFLISQPLVYLVEVPFLGWGIMGFYRNWIMFTALTFPMGFIGYYIKKGKWWGLLILTPILLLLGIHYCKFLKQTVFSFPCHLLSCLFCLASIFLYAVFLFKDKRIRIAGLILSCVIALSATAYSLSVPDIYNTDILISHGSSNVVFDDSYKVYLADESFGSLSIRYEEALKDYMVHAEFKKAGTTEFTLESSKGEKTVFDITVKSDTYTVEKKP